MSEPQPKQDDRRAAADVGPLEQTLRGILWTIALWLAVVEAVWGLMTLAVSSWR